MFDTENRDDRKRSLLAYAREETDEAARDGSLLATGGPAEGETEDAVARHRAARAERAARADRPEPETPAAAQPVADEPARPSLLGRIPGWASSLAKRRGATSARIEPREETPRQFSQEAPAREADTEDYADADEPEDDRQWKPLIDPMKVFAGIARSKLLIIGCTLLGALLGVAIALSTPKKYESATELLIDPRDLKLVDRDLTQAGFSNEATLAIVENQVRVITSGTVLGKVVEQLHLDDDPEFNGQGKGSGLLSSVRSLLSRGGADASDPVRRRSLAIMHLAENLSVERGGKTFVVVIRARTHEADKSALIANTMADVFLKTYGELQSDTAGRATEELTARLDELRRGVETAEHKVEAFKAEHDIIDPQGRLITDDELMKLNEQLSVARARTLELTAKADSTKAMSVDSVVGGVPPEALSSSTMTELRAQYATLKSEEDRLAVRLGPRHPQRQAIEAQLAGARAQIDAELRRIVSSVQTELRRSQQLEQELSSRLAQLKVRQGDVSRDMVTLRELEREAAAKRSVYEAFLLRSRETTEQKDINTANMSVISRAYPPLQAEPPSRTTIALTGTMLGLFAGIGIGGLRGAYRSLSDTAEDRRRRRARRKARPSDAPTGNAPFPPSGPGAGFGFQGQGWTSYGVQHAAPVHTVSEAAPAQSVERQEQVSPHGDVGSASRSGSSANAEAAAEADRLAKAENSIEEIRASLRDFRTAVEELAQSRTRRRYF